MSDHVASRPSLGIRLLAPVLGREPDWSALTPDELAAFSKAENRKRQSTPIRLISGFPDRRAATTWQRVELAERALRVRVHRPLSARPSRRELPVVLHVHGGGFVGTATQSDWVTSFLAARLPAVVVSVEHRLLDHRVSMAAAADDIWGVLRHIVNDRVAWGSDRGPIAVFGESAGATMVALAALRARETGIDLAGQVLVNPCVDLTPTAFDHPSMRQHATTPTLSVEQIEFFLRLAAAEGAEAEEASPLHARSHAGLAPALVVVPTIDPLADHGRAYGDRLRRCGTAVQVSEHPGAVHAFLNLPRLARQATAAREQITDFLRDCFSR